MYRECNERAAEYFVPQFMKIKTQVLQSKNIFQAGIQSYKNTTSEQGEVILSFGDYTRGICQQAVKNMQNRRKSWSQSLYLLEKISLSLQGVIYMMGKRVSFPKKCNLARRSLIKEVTNAQITTQGELYTKCKSLVSFTETRTESEYLTFRDDVKPKGKSRQAKPRVYFDATQKLSKLSPVSERRKYSCHCNPALMMKFNDYTIHSAVHKGKTDSQTKSKRSAPFNSKKVSSRFSAVNLSKTIKSNCYGSE